MKMQRILAAIISLLAGASLEPVDPADDVADAADDVAIERTAGVAIEGDGFYVWDEDGRFAEGWAAALGDPAKRG